MRAYRQQMMIFPSIFFVWSDTIFDVIKFTGALLPFLDDFLFHCKAIHNMSLLKLSNLTNNYLRRALWKE